jgi:hypothetical protein
MRRRFDFNRKTKLDLDLSHVQGRDRPDPSRAGGTRAVIGLRLRRDPGSRSTTAPEAAARWCEWRVLAAGAAAPADPGEDEGSLGKPVVQLNRKETI